MLVVYRFFQGKLQPQIWAQPQGQIVEKPYYPIAEEHKVLPEHEHMSMDQLLVLYPFTGETPNAKTS